ncbi:unnamed protein product [Nezara viridula]|uniref:Ephexin-1 n=1 Tax=Nezara viridula TaxID=85310 RepID=A0A9P0H737_NEZVI|nr:unnamed protein product [Nezara viridula]
MARLLKSDRTPEQRVRRLSFKTRERKAVRTVRVVAGSVTDIASKFNAVVVEDQERGIALLKKLQTHEQGSVRAAVQKFETMQGQKVVLVRKNSLPPEVKEEKIKPKVHPKPKTIDRKTSNKYVTKDLRELVGKDRKFSLPKTLILDEVLNETLEESEPSKSLTSNEKGRSENSTMNPEKTESIKNENKITSPKGSKTKISEKNKGKVNEVKSKLFGSEKENNAASSVLEPTEVQTHSSEEEYVKSDLYLEVIEDTELRSSVTFEPKIVPPPTIIVTKPKSPDNETTKGTEEFVKNRKPNRSFLWSTSESKQNEKHTPESPVDEVKTVIKENQVSNTESETTVKEAEVFIVSSQPTSDRLVEDKENLEKLETPVIRKVDKKGYGKIKILPNSSSLYRNILRQSLIEELKEKQEGKTILKDRSENVPSEEHQYKNLPGQQDTYEYVSQDTYEIIENNYDEIGEEAIYDDVLNTNTDQIYESIYNGRLQGDSDSSCEQSNSLYDLRPTSRASSGSGARGSGASRSDTSEDWVDIELDSAEEMKQHIFLIQAGQKRSCGSWSQKVRRQWSTRKCHVGPHHEDSDSSSKHYELVENLDDDSALCDDFEDSSDSEFSVDNNEKPYRNEQQRLPEVSQSDGIYSLMKEAGKRMRKTSSTIGKSLRKISRISKTTSAQDIFNGTNGMMSRGRWPSFRKKNSLPTTKSTFYLTDSSISVTSTESTNSIKTTEHSSVPPPRPPPPNLDPRRLSLSTRPTSPPPPPPPAAVNGTSANDAKGTSNKTMNDTSLYIESGLFEQNAANQISGDSMNRRAHGNSWYSDIGLYENSKPSDTSSEHGSSQGSDLDLRFADEPLYQFYNERVAKRELAEDASETGYEEIGENRTLTASRPSALELVSPEMQRTLWCHVPQVIDSGILDSLSPEQKRLQEAKFEVVTSEASYYKSLVILEKHFASSPLLKDESVLPKGHYKTLFGNVAAVRKCSEEVLAALEKCWQESILLEGLSDVINKVAEEHFSAYIKYCKHQQAIEKTIKTLKKSNQAFSDALDTLQKSPKCHNLTFYSFVLLPMQRVTRMPLLQDAILTKLTPSDPEYESCRLALARLNKIVHDCNEAARQTERMEEMALLSRSLQFPPEVRPLPLLSASRWLVRSGDVSQISLESRTTFSRRLTAPRTVKLRLFLFTDYLVITKRKGDDTFSVVTYCERNLVQMSDVEEAFSNKFLIMLTLLKNHEGKTQEMALCCGGESSRARWISAMSPPAPTNPGERLYEDWDCPQVFVQHAYLAVQPDELSLQYGDVINVLRKTDDGWYYGERMRDSENGWFPGNHTVEIPSSHVRARNLKQRYRLLALSSSFIQKQQISKLSLT